CGRSGGPQGTAPAIVEVSIDPAAVAIAGGGTIRFIAAVAGTSDAAVTWSTDAGTIDQSGIYTAPNAPGTFSLTARSRPHPGPSPRRLGLHHAEGGRPGAGRDDAARRDGDRNRGHSRDLDFRWRKDPSGRVLHGAADRGNLVRDRAEPRRSGSGLGGDPVCGA